MKKKLFALILAAAMTLGMSMSVFAAGEYSITVNPIAESTVAHTYEAYQVFSGDLSADGKTLSNVKWGNGVTGTITIGGETYDTATAGDAAKLAKALEKLSAADLADAVTFNVPFATKTAPAANAATVIDGLDAGYYIVKDKDGSLAGANDSYSQYIVSVVTNTAITAKADVPSTQKKVKDVNDSTGEATEYQDSADYDIGDDVPFQFSSTVVSNIDAYKTYVYTFHDTEEAGLTYNNDAKVYLNGNEITGTPVTPAAGETFAIAVDLKAAGAKSGDVVTVEYTSKLNENAVLGDKGNKNKMYLEYSNNPNGEGTGKTQEDIVIVFTYKVEVNKVDQDMKKLAGAEFSVEKYDKATDSWKVLTVVKSDDGTVFTVKGIDDGQYRIKETVTPNGFNTISDEYITFVVTATHDVLSDAPSLKELSGNPVDGLVGEYKFAPNQAEGSLSSTIVNQSGAILPSTGGIGTTIFYIIGGLLVVVAGSVLFVRKRMSREDY